MRKHEKRQKPQHAAKRVGAVAVPFFIVLALLTAAAFILPLRPTRSYSEKRNLTPFPTFSATFPRSDTTSSFPTSSPT